MGHALRRSLLVPAFLLVLAAPLLSPAVTIAVENCGNCVDDDGDQIIDRKDSDCQPRANGNNLGIGDVSEGKMLTACAKTTQRAGAKFVLATMKLIFKCTEASATCIQAKPGDQACQDKAKAACATIGTDLEAAATKMVVSFATKCGQDDPSVPSDLLDPTGLGFASEITPCLTEGGTGLANIERLGICIVRQNFCRALHLIAIATPRARELLTFAGVSPGELSCLNEIAGVNGNGATVPPSHVKKLLKCTKTIDGFALSLVATGAKVVQTCLNAGIACLQTKPQDANCIPKAKAKCAADFGKLRDPQKGTVAKLAAKFVKACSDPELDVADIRGPSGLGLDAQMDRCSKLNFPFNLVTCFGAQVFCEGAQIVERQVPRARELADLLDVDLTGLND